MVTPRLSSPHLSGAVSSCIHVTQGGEETAPVSGCALSSEENATLNIAENRRWLSCATTRRVVRADFGDERKRCARDAAADVGFKVRGPG